MKIALGSAALLAGLRFESMFSYLHSSLLKMVERHVLLAKAKERGVLP